MPSWGSEWRWRGSAAERNARRIRLDPNGCRGPSGPEARRIRRIVGRAPASRHPCRFRSPGEMVRAILLGAGPAGERHGRAFRALADRCLVAGVYDSDAEAAKRLAMPWGVPWREALEPAFQEAHVAIIAGAVETRPRLARAALEAGLDVLIEPPLAPTVELAHGLLSAIVRAPRRPVAQVAFDEHFDPTVRELRALVADQTLVAVHADRMDPGVGGPLAELDVVSDLMVHDL